MVRLHKKNKNVYFMKLCIIDVDLKDPHYVIFTINKIDHQHQEIIFDFRP